MKKKNKATDGGKVKQVRSFVPELLTLVEQPGFKFPGDGIVELGGKKVQITGSAVEKLRDTLAHYGKAEPKKACDEFLALLEKKNQANKKQPPKAGESREYKATKSRDRRNTLIPVAHLFSPNDPVDAKVAVKFEKDKITITKAAGNVIVVDR